MPTTAADPPTSRRRLALPLTSGLALWVFAYAVLALPGASDDAGLRTWALATRWIISTAGATLALACTYLLARRLEAHLLARDRTPPAQGPTPGPSRRRSPATVLVAGGATVTALTELLWVFVGPLPSWAFTLVEVIGSALAPAALLLGVHLALRRLEDHLDGRHRSRTPRASDVEGRPLASGLTSPHVITSMYGPGASGG